MINNHNLHKTVEKNTSPTVSVVVTTFNRAELLQETLDSILSQTFVDFELIIVDNMSEDGTEQYVKSMTDHRIQYFRNANNGIIAVNRNLGIRNAKGEYVAFCDDDDIWLPNKLEKQLLYFEENGISCVASDCILIGDVHFITKTSFVSPEEDFKDFSYEEILLPSNPIITSSVLARRDLLCEIGGFDENPDFCFVEDWELWLRLSRKGKVRILTQTLILYRMINKVGRDARQVRLNTLNILDKHNSAGYLDCKILRSARGNCSVAIGKAFLDANDRNGIKYFLTGLLYSSTSFNRVKAIVGVVLFFMPYKIKNSVIQKLNQFSQFMSSNHA